MLMEVTDLLVAGCTHVCVRNSILSLIWGNVNCARQKLNKLCLRKATMESSILLPSKTNIC